MGFCIHQHTVLVDLFKSDFKKKRKKEKIMRNCYYLVYFYQIRLKLLFNVKAIPFFCW